MIEILALIHFGLFGVLVFVMHALAKWKDSKDLHKHKDNPRIPTGTNPWAVFDEK